MKNVIRNRKSQNIVQVEMFLTYDQTNQIWFPLHIGATFLGPKWSEQPFISYLKELMFINAEDNQISAMAYVKGFLRYRVTDPFSLHLPLYGNSVIEVSTAGILEIFRQVSTEVNESFKVEPVVNIPEGDQYDELH